MKQLNIILNYQMKIVGIILSTISLIVMMIVRISDMSVIERLTNTQQYTLFEWGMIFGLYIIAFSKEKNDSDHIKLVRQKSFQTAFLFSHGLLLALIFASNIKPSIILSAYDLLSISSYSIILYLLTFYHNLYSSKYYKATQAESTKNKIGYNSSTKITLAFYTIAAIAIAIMIALMLLRP